MAFSFGSLLTTANAARANARRGQREQQQMDAEAERQRRLDLFNEYARSRQLAQTDTAQENTIEREQMRLDAQRGIQSAKDEAAAERARLNNEVAMWRNQAQFGRRGNEQEVGQYDRTNRSRETMNTADNETAITRQLLQNQGTLAAALARQAAAGQPKPLPPATATRLGSQSMASESKIRDLDEAIAATTGAKDFVGPWDDFRDKAMEKFGQRIDPGRVKARAAYAKVVTPILTGEFGANLTRLEKDYIAPYITSLSEATEERIPIVLGMIRKALSDAREEQLYGLEAAGHGEFAEKLRTPPARGAGRFSKPPQRP